MKTGDDLFTGPPDPEDLPGDGDKTAGVDFIEYEAPNGEKWRLERGKDLVRDFELDTAGPGEALSKWHLAMCGQDPAWTILCRIYGNAPLYGVEEYDDIRAWSMVELAEKRGVEPREIESYLQGARTFWKRWLLEEGRAAGVLPKNRPAADDETAAGLLLEHGFGTISDPEERAYVAGRIVDLAAYLDNDSLRGPARGLIQQEIAIFYVLDPTIRDVRGHIAFKLAHKNSAEKENDQLLKLMASRRDAQNEHNATMKVLGLTDAHGGGLRKKVVFQDCLGTMTLAWQKYFAEGDRELIDGVFAAAEVELLTTSSEIRPMQYRPDLIVAIADAKQHLWEADWKPTAVARRACRKLKAGFDRGLAEARSEEGEVIPDDEENLDADQTSSGGMVGGPLEAKPATLQTPPILPRASTADEVAAMIG